MTVGSYSAEGVRCGQRGSIKVGRLPFETGFLQKRKKIHTKKLQTGKAVGLGVVLEAVIQEATHALAPRGSENR